MIRCSVIYQKLQPETTQQAQLNKPQSLVYNPKLGKHNILQTFNLTVLLYEHVPAQLDKCDSTRHIEVLLLKRRCHNNLGYLSLHEPVTHSQSVSLSQLFHLISKVQRRDIFKLFSWYRREESRILSHVITLCIPLPCRKCHCTQERIFCIVIYKSMAVVPDKHSHRVLCSLHCFSINNSYLQMLQSIKSSFLKDNIKLQQRDSDLHSGSC